MNPIENSADLEELQNKILLRHGIKLDPKDPILMFVTLNEVMLEQTQAKFAAIITDLQMSMAASATVSEEETKKRAERMISAAVKASAEINNKYLETMKSIIDAARKESEATEQLAISKLQRFEYVIYGLIAVMIFFMVFISIKF